jgi:HSP20 family protein
MRLVTRNLNRPSDNSFPTLWNDLFADDFFIKQVTRDENACKTRAKKLDNKTTMPAVNIKDREKHYFIEVSAPGFKKSDFLVEMENSTLTISAKRVEKNEKLEEGAKTEKERYTHREFETTSFKRTFTVPEKTVCVEKIEASYEAGILVVSIPKKEAEETKLNINVL